MFGSGRDGLLIEFFFILMAWLASQVLLTCLFKSSLQRSMTQQSEISDV